MDEVWDQQGNLIGLKTYAMFYNEGYVILYENVGKWRFEGDYDFDLTNLTIKDG